MSEPIARDVLVFSNGLIAVCDQRGEQITELQGADTPHLRAVIHARSDAGTRWQFAREAKP
jgi:hypothetical protein